MLLQFECEFLEGVGPLVGRFSNAGAFVGCSLGDWLGAFGAHEFC